MPSSCGPKSIYGEESGRRVISSNVSIRGAFKANFDYLCGIKTAKMGSALL